MKISLSIIMLIIFLVSACTPLPLASSPVVEVLPTEMQTVTPSPIPPTMEPSPTSVPPTFSPELEITPIPTEESTDQSMEYWEGVPIIPGAIDPKGEEDLTLAFSAQYSLEDAVSFYLEKMAELGWTETYRKDSIEEDLPKTVIDFEKDGTVVTILMINLPINEMTMFGLKIARP